MIKTLDVSLGQLGVMSQLGNPTTIPVPILTAGEVLATGYYTDTVTGQTYYYDATINQWYYSAAGYLYPLALSWQASPSPKIDLIGGIDTLRFNLSFKYMGPAVTQKFRACIGTSKMSGSFDAWSGYDKVKDISIPGYDVPTLITEYIDVPIPVDGRAGLDGGAYCKKDQLLLIEGEDSTPLYYNVCHIVVPEGEFTNMLISKFEKV